MPLRGTPTTLALVTVTPQLGRRARRRCCARSRGTCPGVRIVVVDNASSDDTVAVARGCAQAVVVALAENVGFGRANNRGAGRGLRAGRGAGQPRRGAARRLAAGAGGAGRGRSRAAARAARALRRRLAPGHRAPACRPRRPTWSGARAARAGAAAAPALAGAVAVGRASAGRAGPSDARSPRGRTRCGALGPVRRGDLPLRRGHGARPARGGRAASRRGSGPRPGSAPPRPLLGGRLRRRAVRAAGGGAPRRGAPAPGPAAGGARRRAPGGSPSPPGSGPRRCCGGPAAARAGRSCVPCARARAAPMDAPGAAAASRMRRGERARGRRGGGGDRRRRGPDRHQRGVASPPCPCDGAAAGVAPGGPARPDDAGVRHQRQPRVQRPHLHPGADRRPARGA